MLEFTTRLQRRQDAWTGGELRKFRIVAIDEPRSDDFAGPFIVETVTE
jgi:hypothetical protein